MYMMQSYTLRTLVSTMRFAYTRMLCKVKVKVIPVTGRGGPKDCETSRLSHFLKNWLTDVGVVGLTRRSPFTHRMIPGTHSC
jgi:hypothetical protein